MAIFLNADQIYRTFQRELPEGVYPDVEYSKSFSTASVYAKSAVLKDFYDNMKVIYTNMFPQDADEQIDDWVIKAFGSKFPAGTTLTAKRDAVIAKIRSQPNLTNWQILTAMAGFLPEGTYVQVHSDCGFGAGWPLGARMLGKDTRLGINGIDTIKDVDFSQWCDFLAGLEWRLGRGHLGVTTHLGGFLFSDINRRQKNAFGYEIRVFAPITMETKQAMDLEAARIEPARSGHIIRDNLNLIDFGLVNTVNNVGQFDLVDCITRDSTQTTGYKGLTT
jgi:hypothetical protein